MLPRCCFRVKATPLYPTLDTGAGERRVVSHLNTLASARVVRYRHGDSNPGFRRERAAS